MSLCSELWIYIDRVVFIKVYDKNLTRDHLMGEAMLDTEALDLSSSCEVVLALQAGLDDKLTKRAELQQCGLGRVVVRLSRAADQTEVGPADCRLPYTPQLCRRTLQ